MHLGEDENEDYTRHAITTPDEGSGAKVTTLPNGEIEGPSGPRRAAEPPSGMNSFMTESTNVRVIARETRLPRLSKRFLPVSGSPLPNGRGLYRYGVATPHLLRRASKRSSCFSEGIYRSRLWQQYTSVLPILPGSIVFLRSFGEQPAPRGGL